MLNLLREEIGVDNSNNVKQHKQYEFNMNCHIITQ